MKTLNIKYDCVYCQECTDDTSHYSCNKIANWASVTALSEFPGLVDLRIRDNPFMTTDKDAHCRQFIIARLSGVLPHVPCHYYSSCAGVQSLNGSPISVKERALAERFYLTNSFIVGC